MKRCVVTYAYSPILFVVKSSYRCLCVRWKNHVDCIEPIDISYRLPGRANMQGLKKADCKTGLPLCSNLTYAFWESLYFYVTDWLPPIFETKRWPNEFVLFARDPIYRSLWSGALLTSLIFNLFVCLLVFRPSPKLCRVTVRMSWMYGSFPMTPDSSP